MSWKLWLDDDAGKPNIEAFRNPPDNSWEVAHSTLEAIDLCLRLGAPVMIDFDHDLGVTAKGEVDTALHFCKWLYEHFPTCVIDYRIHSRNPVGAENIRAFMDSWKRSLACPHDDVEASCDQSLWICLQCGEALGPN